MDEEPLPLLPDPERFFLASFSCSCASMVSWPPRLPAIILSLPRDSAGLDQLPALCRTEVAELSMGGEGCRPPRRRLSPFLQRLRVPVARRSAPRGLRSPCAAGRHSSQHTRHGSNLGEPLGLHALHPAPPPSPRSPRRRPQSRPLAEVVPQSRPLVEVVGCAMTLRAENARSPAPAG